VEVAGNIGRALAEVALRSTPPEWIALELSSYQLHDTPGVAPGVGVLTNLAPDHLDRYRSIDDYFADKRLLFRNATAESRWAINFDDDPAMQLAADVPGAVLRFSAEGRLGDAFLDRAHGRFIVLDEPLVKRAEFPLLGMHNVSNALAAALAVMVADPSHSSLEARRRIAHGLRSASALPHRVQPVGEYDGVLWIDDSKATNVASARVGIDAMTRPTILLLGGRHKGEPYTALLEPIRRHCRGVLVFGEAGEIIARDLGADPRVERIRGTFGDVVARARTLAEPGDAVLLSPACSSFDMFANYEERGDAFSALAPGKASRSSP
jgi:UDP-N-acetylmuramoylalanine--D-glutamate ligase